MEALTTRRALLRTALAILALGGIAAQACADGMTQKIDLGHVEFGPIAFGPAQFNKIDTGYIEFRPVLLNRDQPPSPPPPLTGGAYLSVQDRAVTSEPLPPPARKRKSAAKPAD